MNGLPSLGRLPSLPSDSREHVSRDDELKIDTYAVPDLVSSQLNGFNVFAEGDERITWLLYFIICTSSISNLLFGYDTGVIAGALIYIGGDLGPPRLSDSQKEFVTSATTVGALIGGLAAGAFSDFVGRKWVMALGDLLFIAGSLCQALAHTVWMLIGGRFLAGIGVGVGMCVAPLYAQELSPTRMRGRMVVMGIVGVTFGQLLGYGLSSGFEDVPRGWRWMFGVGAVLGAVQLYLLTYLPESPRILIRRGEVAAAEIHLSRIYADCTATEISLKTQALQSAVQMSIDIHERTTFSERVGSIFRIPSNRRALIVACGLQALQQLCGFNTLMYYGASLFQTIGFHQPTLVGLLVSGTNLLFTLVAMRFIDRVGRRRVLLWSVPAMWFGLALAAVAFHFLTRSTGGQLRDDAAYPRQWSSVVLFSILVYISGYALGLGCVPWAQAELFALEVRGICAGISTGVNWAAALLVGATYLPLVRSVSAAGTFGIYAGLVVFGYAFIVSCFPETANLSLEEVRGVFRDDFGVRAARRLREDKAMLRKHMAVSLPSPRTP